jgi:phage anti-repressor protein
MNDLVRIEKLGFGNEEVNSVNLRDVWSFVESKRQFADWKESRLKRAVEGVDFIIHANVNALNKEKSRVDYIVSIELAKSICMLEDNEKGDELRKYFIDCEKRLLSNTPSLPSNYIEALKALIESEESKQKLIGERDHAIKTKAQISDSKTASAMGTASAQKRRADKLERDLNLLKEKTGNVSKEVTEAILENLFNDVRVRKDLDL